MPLSDNVLIELVGISWTKLASSEFKKPYFDRLVSLLRDERAKLKIFPPKNLVFTAFQLTLPEEIKVVILGQDPYHTEGHAHGLAFSTLDVRKPPSLKNIFKEIEKEFGMAGMEPSGDLTYLAKQGVFLLNTILTVREGEPLSHQNIGWKVFTRRIIEMLVAYKAERNEPLVFLLWGNHAAEYSTDIDMVRREFPKEAQSKITMFLATHPSPFSYEKGFKDCGHFTKTNEFLKQHNTTPINWLP